MMTHPRSAFGASPSRGRRLRTGKAGSAAAAWLLLAACAGGPPPADWQLNAQSASEAATAAYLAGDSAAETRHFERARSEVSRTGSPQRMARIELLRCAAHVASLVFEACPGYERLQADADAPERAYAQYLAGRAQAPDIELLPAVQRGVARGGPAALREVADPLSRLVAAAVLFQQGRADPTTIALAVDTASAQGWRRPLLAWLNVQLARAEHAGDTSEVERLRRRIALAQGLGE